MDPEKQRVIASKGGKAAHEHGAAHEYTVEEARVAGTKGGKATAHDREHMAEIGRRGGLSRARRVVKSGRKTLRAYIRPQMEQAGGPRRLRYRGENEILTDVNRIVGFLRNPYNRKGVSAVEILAALQMDYRALPRVLKVAIAKGYITKTGNRAATVYRAKSGGTA